MKKLAHHPCRRLDSSQAATNASRVQRESWQSGSTSGQRTYSQSARPGQQSRTDYEEAARRAHERAQRMRTMWEEEFRKQVSSGDETQRQRNKVGDWSG